MLVKTITYTDYNGTERTENFYFNISKAELLELNFTIEGGLEQLLQRIVKAKDIPQLAKLFKQLIRISYGRKSDDGRILRKSEEISDEFIQSEAYSELYVELMTDTDKAIEFVNSIVPSDIVEFSREKLNSELQVVDTQ